MQTSFESILARIIILLVAFPVHELAHAWTADYFGDDTPRSQGRLSFNPLAHLDIFGSILLMFAGFGWAKPVMVDTYRLRRNSEYAPLLVTLAGPASNLVLAVMGVIPIWMGFRSGFFQEFFFYFSFINLILFFFNMIPLFPLDGEKIAIEVLPSGGQNFFLNLRRFTFGPLLILLLLGNVGINILGYLVFNPSLWLLRLLLP